jgi:hypothetical protein
MKLINLDEICSLVPLITLKPGYPTFPSGRDKTIWPSWSLSYAKSLYGRFRIVLRFTVSFAIGDYHH